MFEELISLVRREQVSLFIGAGFSKEAGAPSVWDLQKSILERIYDTEKENPMKMIVLLIYQTFLLMKSI